LAPIDQENILSQEDWPELFRSAITVLKAIEWRGPNGRCMQCGGRGDHADDCELATVLAFAPHLDNYWVSKTTSRFTNDDGVRIIVTKAEINLLRKIKQSIQDNGECGLIVELLGYDSATVDKNRRYRVGERVVRTLTEKGLITRVIGERHSITVTEFGDRVLSHSFGRV
jgi:hypothetical protein